MLVYISMTAFCAQLSMIAPYLGSTYFRIPCDCSITRMTLFLSNRGVVGWNQTNTCSILRQTTANFTDEGEQISPNYLFDGGQLQTLIDVTDFSDWSNTGNFKNGDIIWLGWCRESVCRGASIQCTLDFLAN